MTQIPETVVARTLFWPIVLLVVVAVAPALLSGDFREEWQTP